MGELHRPRPSPSAVRFLGILNQSSLDPDSLDLDEVDLIWPTTVSDITCAPTTPERMPPSPHSASSSEVRARFLPSKLGLSAALSDELCSLIHRKTCLKPPLSATSAAHATMPLAVPEPRSGFFQSQDRSRSLSRNLMRSAPVNVPVWTLRSPAGVRRSGLEDFEDEAAAAVEEMLPPHEMVARSQRTSTFSVVQGKGRTLKGRDLWSVRDAVLQRTAFLD